MAEATVEKKEKKEKKQRQEVDLKAAEADLRKKYPRVIKGTLRDVGQDPNKDPRWKHKRTVEIRCAKRGCQETRRVATSDLHQVTLCEEHTAEARKERRKKQQAARRKPK